MHELVGLNLIKATRGEISILNRRGIEKTAGSYYGAPEAEYRRLVPEG
jgi:hypothetical protein